MLAAAVGAAWPPAPTLGGTGDGEFAPEAGAGVVPRFTIELAVDVVTVLEFTSEVTPEPALDVGTGAVALFAARVPPTPTVGAG